MIRTRYFALAVGVLAVACHEPPGATAPSRPLAAAQPADSSHNPTWWNKYLYLAQNGPMSGGGLTASDRKSTRLNSSHLVNSYAVFCLKKKKNAENILKLTLTC